jgi:hypothetical protein
VVSRAKFERELEQYRASTREYRRRGWLLLDATFPEVCVAFVVPSLTPAQVIYTVLINFTNYDLHPPSVKFVNLQTREPEKKGNVNHMLRMQPNGQTLNMLQAYTQDEPPFLCLPGVAEYHSNPGHTADAWLLHRGSGEGTLYFILEQIWKYGVAPLKGAAFEIQIRQTGWQVEIQK